MSESTKVIIKKNEGRVAAGKKLAEWNRKYKADLRKNVGKSTSQDDQEHVVGSSKSMNPMPYIYSAGGLAVLAACVAVYYIRKQLVAAGEPAPDPSPGGSTATAKAKSEGVCAPQQKPSASQIDIFKMR